MSLPSELPEPGRVIETRCSPAPVHHLSDSIFKLGVSDFDEAIAHLSLVFNDPNFAELVPALYQPTDVHMRNNLAIRRNGRIAAIVGVFPIDWVVGDERLKVAGIGGVSVRPEFRGQGLMRMLMDAAMDEIKHGGFHAACLGGNRRRYGHWGFEKAGVEATFVVTANSLEPAGCTPPVVAINAIESRFALASDMPALHAISRKQPIHCSRTPHAFALHLFNWRRQPIVAVTPEGRVSGYCCFDPKDSSIVECCFENDDGLAAFLSRHVDSSRPQLRVTVPLLRSGRFNRLEQLSDDVSVIEAANWRIYDWPAVLGALLRVKHTTAPLSPGSCVVKVLETSTASASRSSNSFRLNVDERASCLACDDRPDFEAPAGHLLRALTGPLTPMLPPAARVLAQWRPLPLAIPMQDRI